MRIEIGVRRTFATALAAGAAALATLARPAAATTATAATLLADELARVRFLNAGEIRAADAPALVWLPVRQEDTEPENVTVNPYTWQAQGPWAYYGEAVYLFSNTSGAPVPPPLGLRSAVPLGGVGAGALELRGDGSFHDVTIINQSPAGAAKFGVLADMLLAVRAGAGDARAVRTQAPQQARGRGVAQITYSGSYPVSRLALADATLPAPLDGAAVFAFSTLVPGDIAASATPAVAFSLAASNPTAAPQNVSFFLSLPFAAVNDCYRNGSATGVVARLPGLQGGYAACLRACTANAACASWSFTLAGALCELNRFVVMSVFLPGAYCGVPGTWASDGRGALTLTMNPPGYVPSSPRGNFSSAVGDMTLRGLADDGAGGGPGSASVSVGVSDDPAALFAAFEATGGFAPGSAPGIIAGGGAAPFFNITAAHGAAAVTVLLAPGARAAISLVFAWSFPHRMHCGRGCSCEHGDNNCCGAPDPVTLVICEELLGNFYQNIFESSAAAAASLAADARSLAAAAAAVNAHHAVFSSEASSLPEWLQDAAVNQFSHLRTLMLFGDGRARQWEALDCPDVDSVHNDYQRHLPYLWLMPQVEVSKMRAWASVGQDPDGHIVENIASFSLGPMDEPGGRVMGDTSSVFVLELLELWRHLGDEALLAELWPSAVRATQWMASNAAVLGLPLHLVCTYDMLGIESHNVTTYNSFLFLAAMRAASTLAAHLGDAATQALADAATTRGQAAMAALLFEPRAGFFRAFQGGAPGNESAVMADCAYGQMIALQHGLGLLAPAAQLQSHLAVEVGGNMNRFGLRCMSDPGAAPTGDTNWMNGAPTASYLGVALLDGVPSAEALAAALEPTRRTAENYRSRLNDLWDLHGLTTDDSGSDADENKKGQPFITSHYGLHVPYKNSCRPSPPSSHRPPQTHPCHCLRPRTCAPLPYPNTAQLPHELLPARRALGTADRPRQRPPGLFAQVRLPLQRAAASRGPHGHVRLRRRRDVHGLARLRQPRAAGRRPQRQRACLPGRGEPGGGRIGEVVRSSPGSAQSIAILGGAVLYCRFKFEGLNCCGPLLLNSKG